MRTPVPAAAAQPASWPGATLRAMLLAAALLPAACAAPRPGAPAASAGTGGVDQRQVAVCRAQADRAYAEQNRAELSQRDTQYAPFSSSGVTGITTTGLSQRYARDEMISDCLRRAGAVKATPENANQQGASQQGVRRGAGTK